MYKKGFLLSCFIGFWLQNKHTHIYTQFPYVGGWSFLSEWEQLNELTDALALHGRVTSTSVSKWGGEVVDVCVWKSTKRCMYVRGYLSLSITSHLSSWNLNPEILFPGETVTGFHSLTP